MNKITRILFWGVLTTLLQVCALLIPSCQDELPHLSDQEMIENFYQHRNEFERLREMLILDQGLVSVARDSTYPVDLQRIQVSATRIKEYRALLNKVNIRDVWTAKNRHLIDFIASHRGMVTHSSLKGYRYAESETIEMPIIDNLNHLATKVGVNRGMRRIEGNWYLFFIGD